MRSIRKEDKGREKSRIRKKVQNSDGRRRLSRMMKRKIWLGIHEEKITEET
jgi:hypothetical protein